MKLWIAFCVLTCALAQVAPERVNATAGDGILRVEWSLPLADSRIESFTVSAVPTQQLNFQFETSANTTVYEFDGTTLETTLFEFMVGPCTDMAATWLASTQAAGGCNVVGAPPTVANTFVQTGGRLTMLTRPFHALPGSLATSLHIDQNQQSGNDYRMNGVPRVRMLAADTSVDSVYAGTFSWNLWSGSSWMHQMGLEVMDRDANGRWRPLISYMFNYQTTGSFSNTLQLRVLNSNGVGYTWVGQQTQQGFSNIAQFSTTTVPPTFPPPQMIGTTLQLAIQRNRREHMWRFYYAHPNLNGGRWTNLHWLDVYDTMLPPDMQMNATVAAFSASDITSTGLPRTAVIDKLSISVGDAVDIFQRNMTNWEALTPETGLCNLVRAVTRTGLHYDRSRLTYSYTLRGVLNGVSYVVSVTAVGTAATGGGRTTTTVPGTRVPAVSFPVLQNSPNARPALFLDSLSVYAGNVFTWQDASGNGRNVVQYNPLYQPTSNGVSSQFPNGAVFFPITRNELYQENKGDTGLDLGSNPGGMSIFAQYQLGASPSGATSFPANYVVGPGFTVQLSPYMLNHGLMSRMPAVHSNTTGSTALNRHYWTSTSQTFGAFGQAARPLNDNPGWEIWAWHSWYSETTTGVPLTNPNPGAGMRVIASKQAGSTIWNPNPNHVGVMFANAQFNFGNDPGSSGPDWAQPTLYTYNYHPVPAGGYAIGSTTVAQGQWVLDGCRGINFGLSSDICLYPNPTSSVGTSVAQISTNVPWWKPGFGSGHAYQWYGTQFFIRPTTNVLPAGTPNNQGNGLFKISDALFYFRPYYNYYPSGAKNFWGRINGILLYRDAIVSRADKQLVQQWIGERYGTVCPVLHLQQTIVNQAPAGAGITTLPACIAASGTVNTGAASVVNSVPTGTSCATSCGNNRQRLGGYAPAGGPYTCSASGFWPNKGTFCGLACAAQSMPLNGATCIRHYVRESFNQPASTLLRLLPQYDTVPQLSYAAGERIWSFTGSMLRGSVPYTVESCGPVMPSLFATNRPVWGEPDQPVGSATFSVSIILEDNGASGGIAFRVYQQASGATDYYRAYITAGSRAGIVELVRIGADGREAVSRLGSGSFTLPAGMEPVPGVPIRMEAVAMGGTATIRINGVQYFQDADFTVSNGGVGAFVASGTVLFDDLSMSGSCASNGNCASVEGGACEYRCGSGFTTRGPSIRSCTSTGFDDSTPLVCVPEAPVPGRAQFVFNMLEDAPAGTLVGNVNVTVAATGSLDRVVIYSIVAGNNDTVRGVTGVPLIPPQQFTDMFSISLCGGTITANQAGAFNRDFRPEFNLRVRAALAVDLSVFTEFPVTVKILPARLGPIFVNVAQARVSSYPLLIDENSPVGAAPLFASTTSRPLTCGNQGQICAVMREIGQRLEYIIVGGNEYGLFRINNSTGQLTVARAGLDFEGPAKAGSPGFMPNTFDLLIVARDADFPSLFSVVTATISVFDINDPPTAPGQEFDLMGGKANNWTILSMVPDPYFQPPDLFTPIPIVPNPVGTLRSVTDDDRDVVEYSMVSQMDLATRRSVDFFAVNTTTGAVTVARNISIFEVRRNQSVVDGRLTHAVYNLGVRIADQGSKTNAAGGVDGPKSSIINVKVYVLADASSSVTALISSVEIVGGGSTLSTAGGDALLITGSNFNSITQAQGTNLVTGQLSVTVPGGATRTHPFLDLCVILTDTEMRCPRTGPGFGVNMGVILRWSDGADSLSLPYVTGVPALLSYSPPSIISVAVDTSVAPAPANKDSYSTAGGQSFLISATNTGPAGTPVIVRYASADNRFAYQPQAMTVQVVTPSTRTQPGTIRAGTVAGIGSRLVVGLIAGDQQAPVNSNVFIGYAPPVISSIAIAPGTAAVPLDSFFTVQATTPQRIDIIGNHFGPVMTGSDITVHMVYAGAPVRIDGQAPAPLNVVLATSWSKYAGNTTTVIRMDVPSGFGRGYSLRVTVGGQVSTVFPANLGYALPTVSSISGLGTRNALTNGGQTVVLTGTNLGPTAVFSNPTEGANIRVPTPFSITYGPTGFETAFIARGCVGSVSGTTITCVTDEGSGNGLFWRISVGGLQPASQPTFQTAYGYPVVTSLSRVAGSLNEGNNNYLTAGFNTGANVGEVVFIEGSNFGPMRAGNSVNNIASPNWAVRFVLKLEQTVSARNSSLGAASDGTITTVIAQSSTCTDPFVPCACIMSVPHTQLRCNMPPGSGKELAWTVRIDGLVGTGPTIGYRAPRLTAATMMDGSPATSVSSDGGQTVIIQGSGFGPSGINCRPLRAGLTWPEVGTTACLGYIQSLTYGPTGTEYLATSIHLVDPNTIYMRTEPGFGSNLRFSLVVAEQPSLSSTANMSYARPLVTSVSPAAGPASAPADSYAVTITGRNFGLQDTRAGQSVLFGNPEDRTVSAPLPVFNPQIGDFDSDGIIDHRISFYLPAGVLPDRAVRVVVHPRGRPADGTAVTSDPLASPVDAGRGKLASMFDYAPPVIDTVVVGSVPTDAATTVWLFQRGFSAVQIQSPDMRRLTILGANFGPESTRDAVVRDVVWADCSSAEPVGASCTTDLLGVPRKQGEIFSWSTNAIVVYTTAPEGKVLLELAGRRFDRSSVSVTSNAFVYKTLAPVVGNIVAPPMLSTAGGQVIQVNMFNLDTLAIGGNLDVLVHTQDHPVTGDPVYTPATIVNTNGQPFISFNAMKAALIDPVRTAGLAAGQPASTWVYTIPIRVPAGEGTNRAVQVIRDTETSLPSAQTISYAPPTVSAWQVYDDVSRRWISTSVPTATPLADMIVPTLLSRFRLIGQNFGLCPQVMMGDLQRPVFVQGAGGAACTHPSTLAAVESNNHTYLTFMTQPGQGSGQNPSTGVNGFRFELTAAGQSTSAQRVNGQALVIRWRYMAPRITALSPLSSTPAIATGRTAGGDTLILRGYNLGFVPEGMKVVIGDKQCTDVRYVPAASTDVERASEQTVRCTIPEGSGAGHAVSFQAVDYTCTVMPPGSGCSVTNPNAFRYMNPHISAIFLGGTGSMSSTLGADALLLSQALTQDGTAPAVSAPAWVHTPVLPAPGTQSAALYAAALAQVASPGVELINSTGFPVRIASRGGALMALVGDNFGSLDLNQHCLFFAWGGRDRARDLACDNAETFLGENEIPDAAILHWSHTLILLVSPPGYGGREIIPVVRGQAMTWAASMHYQQPSIRAPLSPATGDTEGGTNVTITGSDFGFAPLDTSTRQPTFPLPAPATLQEYLGASQLPQAAMRVNFFRRCISNHLDVTGAKAPSTAVCTLPRASSYYHGHTRISFPSEPGIGVNRTVTVQVLDRNTTTGAVISYVSNNVTFSYNPPFIYASNPSPVRMDAEPTARYAIQLPGLNLGNPPDEEQVRIDPQSAWSAEELLVDVKVGGAQCARANRFVSVTVEPTSGATLTSVELRCDIPLMTVGYKNISYVVAGQRSFNSELANGGFPTNAVFMACRADFFGIPGETCAPCPAGAVCRGFDSRPIAWATAAESSPVFRQRGQHTYPIPLPGFYNLNSSDLTVERLRASGAISSTDTQYSLACPQAVRDRYPDRDVCIVACEPAEACLGGNTCAEGYRSLAPQFRCSYCDIGFYKRNNECVRCPNSPWALVIGFCALVLFGAGAAYVLNKKKINIAFIAIFVDWAQVIAIFAASRVAWPPIVKELFNILSAFNLNIEIVAPECIVPDLQFRQKWSFIMILPIALTGFFMLITAVQVAFATLIKRRKVSIMNQGSSFASMTLLLMYVLYIYLTRNILDVFNCQPREPDEGKYYLTVGSGEECYVPGGTQAVLFGPAIVAAVGYIAGYPAVVAAILWRSRFLAAEDQLLRAKGQGDDKLSNPRAYMLRKRFSRLYYQFKPESILWILVILIRKFCLAATYILFNRNSSFQLAAALLVLFVAYAAQMKYQPYMGPSDFEGVIKAFEVKALEGDAYSVSLWTKIKNVQSRGRKTAYKNLMSSTGKVDVGALLGLLRGWLFAYNTVEEILLFSAGTVALMGIMYASLNPQSTNFNDARDSVTWVIVGAIILTILYFFTVTVTEVYVLYTVDHRRKQLESQDKRRKRKVAERDADGVTDDVASKDRAAIAATAMSTADVGMVSSEYNPLFDSSTVSTAGLREAVADSADLPSVDLWRLFRQGYQQLYEDLDRLSKEAAEMRVRRQKMEEAAAVLEAATGKKVELSLSDSTTGNSFRAGKKRQEFTPVGSPELMAGSVSAGASPLNAFRRTPSGGKAAASPMLRGGPSLRSLKSLTPSMQGSAGPGQS